MSTASPSNDLHRTETVLRRQLRVRYPLAEGRIVLRTDLDYRDLHATSVTDEGTTCTFEVEAKRPLICFKSCWPMGDETRWAVGSNSLVLMTAQGTRDVNPYFSSSAKGLFSPLIEIDSPVLGRTHLCGAYLSPGALHAGQQEPVFEQDESAWGKRIHLPLELLLGKVATASRGRDE